jgi:hypothetical protein
VQTLRHQPAVERADEDFLFHAATPRLTTSQHNAGAIGLLMSILVWISSCTAYL